MPQPANRRLATEQLVADTAATKVNSSTYTAGLAAKQDAATLGATVAADTTVRTSFVLPKAGSYTYNPDGTVATGPDGETYTYNSDGTVATITLNGTTRTFSYNTDGTVAAVA